MSKATIIGKGPSARDIWSRDPRDLVIGVNHAAYRNCVDIACCADQVMLADYERKGVGKLIVIGQQRDYRLHHTVIRMGSGHGSSGALAIHYLASIGYDTVSLVGFDAYVDYLNINKGIGSETPTTRKYKSVNECIDIALYRTGIRCVLE